MGTMNFPYCFNKTYRDTKKLSTLEKNLKKI